MYQTFGKRTIDILVAIIGIVITLPLMLVIVIACAIAFNGRVLFIQDRVGKNERIFRLYKFISMRPADSEHPKSDTERLTPFGNRLRKAGCDELPQLFNILKGDMSLIGPRPLLPRYLPFYTVPEKARHAVLPGITGLAQVTGRNSLDWESRLHYDLQYVRAYSLWLDLQILMRTFFTVFKNDAHYTDPRAILPDLDLVRSKTHIDLGDGIRMRPLSISDAAMLLAVKNNAEAAEWLEQDPQPFTLASMQQWIQFHQQRPANKIYILESLPDLRIIGHCGLYDIDETMGTCTFGILIGLPNYWHRGIGKRAIAACVEIAKNIQGMRTIQLHVLKEHARAIHVYTQLGFTEMGILREHTVKNGIPRDVMHMQLMLT